MRASFHGQNIFALGNGFARLQTPPLLMDEPDTTQDSQTPQKTIGGVPAPEPEHKPQEH